MYRLILLGLLLGLVGCMRPIKVVTEDRLRFDNPLAAEIVPTSNAKPIVAMPVNGQAKSTGGPHVAIIDVDGLLVNSSVTGPYASGDNPVDLFREKLDAAAHDPCIIALVVRINSPGGSVTATDIMWRELQRFREQTHRPVIACLMDIGASGAYYLATASDQIIAHPTTVTGGIGVVLNLFNLEDAMNVLNITSQSVKAGNQIDLGTVTAALTPEAKLLLQGMADEFHERFRHIVLQQRPKVDATDGTNFDGRILTASQAMKRGLIDRVGYLDEAVAAAGAMACQPQAGAVVLHRSGDVARTPFATTPNVPLQTNLFPLSLPGLERSKLPTFLYMWSPDPTLERLGGK